MLSDGKPRPPVKPAAARLYGRTRGKTLRPRQQLLLDVTLPRLLLPPGAVSVFPAPVRELWIEVGFGGGEHARATVAANPAAGLVACEVYENGVCSLLSALVDEGGEADAPLPGNLLVWTDDARTLLRSLPDGAVSRLFLMFPDPWPKARHAKRRFVHPDTLPLLGRVMHPGAEWRIATDDPTYQAWTADVLARQSVFTVTPPATVRPDGWPPTRYEQKALREGRAPLYWSVTRAG